MELRTLFRPAGARARRQTNKPAENAAQNRAQTQVSLGWSPGIGRPRPSGICIAACGVDACGRAAAAERGINQRAAAALALVNGDLRRRRRFRAAIRRRTGLLTIGDPHAALLQFRRRWGVSRIALRPFADALG
jgi:hypothetical protein